MLSGTFVTVADVSVFAIDRSVRVRTTAALRTAGVTWDDADHRTLTDVDTFDGRLAASGLRLTIVDGRRADLRGRGTISEALVAEALPTRAEQLPFGALRSAVTAAVGHRSLVPQLSVAGRHRFGRVIGADGAPLVQLERTASVRMDHLKADSVDVLEVHLVRGSRRVGRALIAELEAAGAQPIDGDVVDYVVRKAGRTLGGFDASPRTALEPGMASDEGFRLVLADHVDAQFLHDFRVALRRTRSIVTAGRSVLAAPEVEAARTGLGHLASSSSAARDLDVYLQRWPRYTADLTPETVADLEPLRLLLRDRAVAEHAELGKVLRSPESLAVLADWQRWLAAPHTRSGDSGHAPLDATVAQLILRSHRVLIERGRLITPESPAEQVHDLRKDTKRLRYLLECFGTLFAAAPRRRYVKRLKVLQDNLGAHQDAEVHVTQLTGFADELYTGGAGASTLLALGRLTERMDQARRAARWEFAQRFAEYDTAATTRALNDVVDSIR